MPKPHIDASAYVQVVQFTANTNASDLLNANPWLASTKLVVKPDMLFGQRGKNDLVGLNMDFSQVCWGGGVAGEGESWLCVWGRGSSQYKRPYQTRPRTETYCGTGSTSRTA